MRACRVVMLFGLIAISAWGAQGKGTADWIRAQGPALEGTTVALNVVFLRGRESADADKVIEGYTFVWAYTAYRNQGGGWIEVAIPTAKLKTYLRKYGAYFDWKSATAGFFTRELRGKLVRAMAADGTPLWYVRARD